MNGAIPAGHQHNVAAGFDGLRRIPGSVAGMLRLHQFGIPAGFIQIGGQPLEQARHIPRAAVGL
jgi:hypothetical protein